MEVGTQQQYYLQFTTFSGNRVQSTGKDIKIQNPAKRIIGFTVS